MVSQSREHFKTHKRQGTAATRDTDGTVGTDHVVPVCGLRIDRHERDVCSSRTVWRPLALPAWATNTRTVVPTVRATPVESQV